MSTARNIIWLVEAINNAVKIIFWHDTLSCVFVFLFNFLSCWATFRIFFFYYYLLDTLRAIRRGVSYRVFLRQTSESRAWWCCGYSWTLWGWITLKQSRPLTVRCWGCEGLWYSKYFLQEPIIKCLDTDLLRYLLIFWWPKICLYNRKNTRVSHHTPKASVSHCRDVCVQLQLLWCAHSH